MTDKKTENGTDGTLGVLSIDGRLANPMLAARRLRIRLARSASGLIEIIDSKI
jgi:hypothetical protein